MQQEIRLSSAYSDISPTDYCNPFPPILSLLFFLINQNLTRPLPHTQQQQLQQQKLLLNPAHPALLVLQVKVQHPKQQQQQQQCLQWCRQLLLSISIIRALSAWTSPSWPKDSSPLRSFTVTIFLSFIYLSFLHLPAVYLLVIYLLVHMQVCFFRIYWFIELCVWQMNVFCICW